MNDIILTLVRKGDNLNIKAVEIIPNSTGNNAVYMAAVEEVRDRVMNDPVFYGWEEDEAAQVLCNYEGAVGANGETIISYKEQGMVPEGYPVPRVSQDIISIIKTAMKGSRIDPAIQEEIITMLNLDGDDPMESVRFCIAFSSRDWSEQARDAWMYGIVCGWSRESLQELKVKFGWNESDMIRLLRLRKRWVQKVKL